MDSKLYDVIIVGGGPGGLQAAIQLGRYRWKVLIIDQGKGRASFVPKYMNILGFPGGISGQAILKSGRNQAESYGVEFLSMVVTQISQDPDGSFSVTVQDKADVKAGSLQNHQDIQCRKLILDSGVMDRHPEVPDVFRWAGQGIYYCPDCDGYEVLNKRVAVIGKGNGAADLALTLLNWTKHIQVINVEPDKAISPERTAQLKSFDIPVFTGELREFIGETPDIIEKVILQDGTELVTEKVFSALGKAEINSELAQKLGVEITESGYVIVDPRTKETRISGCWAVGDVVANHSQQVTLAMGDGVQAAIWVNKRLRSEGLLPPG